MGKAAAAGYREGWNRPSHERSRPAGHRGNDDGMSVNGDRTQHGTPSVVHVTLNRTPARDRLGRLGWRRGPQYLRNRVTPVEGRGLGSRSTSYVTDIQGIDVSLLPPIKVGKLQTVLHTKAKNSPDYRFYALYDKLYRRDVLEWAFIRCLRNGGALGVDGQSFADIETYGEERWLDELTEELRNETYRP